MAPSYKIIYFNLTAIAEPSRMLLKYANIDFEDERIEREAWPELKPSMPFGQLPILSVNGKQYHQSVAVARYLAKQAKLVGEDDAENMEIDMMVDTVNDLKSKIAAWSYEQDATIKNAKRTVFINETLPYYLERLDKIARDNDGHLACNKLTWADFFFVGLLDYLNFAIEGNLIEKHSNLQQVRENVVTIPQIKKWLEERPKGPF